MWQQSWTICNYIIVHNSLKLAWNCSKFSESIGPNTLYRFAKFERKIKAWEGCALNYFWFCAKEKEKRQRTLDDFQEHISHKLPIRFLWNLICKVVYIQSIKYVNLLKIGLIILEIQGAEISDFMLPVNNLLVYPTSILATDTQPCVLICCRSKINVVHDVTYFSMTCICTT